MRSVALAVTLSLAGSLGAQGIVRGTVTTEQGQRVMGVEVSVPSLRKSVRTDSTGEYRLVLPEGRYWMTVRALGFINVGDSIAPENNVELIDDVVLRSVATILDTVNTRAERRPYISPGLRAFEERRREGFGKFITEEDLRRADNRQVSDVLRRIAGLRMRQGRGSAYHAVSTRTGCAATVYLDGALLYDPNGARMRSSVGMRGAAAEPPDVNAFQVRELAGVEFYSGGSTAPPQYPDRGCGVLLLWTRER